LLVILFRILINHAQPANVAPRRHMELGHMTLLRFLTSERAGNLSCEYYVTNGSAYTPVFAAAAGHRMALLQYHTHVLANEGGTVWRQYTAEEYARVLRARSGAPQAAVT